MTWIYLLLCGRFMICIYKWFPLPCKLDRTFRQYTCDSLFIVNAVVTHLFCIICRTERNFTQARFKHEKKHSYCSLETLLVYPFAFKFVPIHSTRFPFRTVISSVLKLFAKNHSSFKNYSFYDEWYPLGFYASRATRIDGCNRTNALGTEFNKLDFGMKPRLEIENKPNIDR